MLLRAILGHVRNFENTVEVGEADLKGGQFGGDNLLLIWVEGKIYTVRKVKKEGASKGASKCIDGKGNCLGSRVGCLNELCVAAWESDMWAWVRTKL